MVRQSEMLVDALQTAQVGILIPKYQACRTQPTESVECSKTIIDCTADWPSLVLRSHYIVSIHPKAAQILVLTPLAFQSNLCQ